MNIIVSVIIVTFNNQNVIQACLESLARQNFQDFEVIVIDNNSRDSTLTIVNRYSFVKLIQLPQNNGFTGGNIKGLEYASGKYIALLNPDTEVSSQWLEVLVEAMEQQPGVGICASKLVAYDTGCIDSAGDGCSTTGRGFKKGEGKGSTEFDKMEYTFGACGGAMFVRRTLIEEIGFLDNDYFLIYEDTDFNFRAQLAGWKCLFVPQAVVFHHVRTSIGTLSDMAVYYSVRNSKYVFLKNMPTGLIVKYFYQQFIQEFGSFLYFGVIHGKFKPYFLANLDFIKNIPLLLKKRRSIKKICNVSPKAIDNVLTSIWQKRFFIEKIKKLSLREK